MIFLGVACGYLLSFLWPVIKGFLVRKEIVSPSRGAEQAGPFLHVKSKTKGKRKPVYVSEQDQWMRERDES